MALRIPVEPCMTAKVHPDIMLLPTVPRATPLWTKVPPTLTTSIHITCKLAKFYFQAHSTFDPNRL